MGQLLIICIQFSKRKNNILAEMLKISKSGSAGYTVDTIIIGAHVGAKKNYFDKMGSKTRDM